MCSFRTVPKFFRIILQSCCIAHGNPTVPYSGIDLLALGFSHFAKCEMVLQSGFSLHFGGNY